MEDKYITLNITNNESNIEKITNYVRVSNYNGNKMVGNVERMNKMVEDNKKKKDDVKEDTISSVELGDIITSENGMSFEVISEERIEDDKSNH